MKVKKGEKKKEKEKEKKKKKKKEKERERKRKKVKKKKKKKKKKNLLCRWSQCLKIILQKVSFYNLTNLEKLVILEKKCELGIKSDFRKNVIFEIF